MQLNIAAIVLLACIAGTAAVRSGPRLRETSLTPAISAGSFRSLDNGSPERVAGYFSLNRTYAGARCRLQSCFRLDTYLAMLR